MSYTVLALKWRPRRFDQLVGQQHVVQALVNSLAENRLHHAYLFSGTRGVGKTTVARLLAKALNCETGVVPEPCGVCSTCVAIDEGRFVDLIEVDAASRTRVDDTRELLDNVQYAPTRGRFKVYLIDEVHMLSNHSFNALLKTLEEPPPHVKFLFATTDPQKLPVTVLSRCLQFNLKKHTAAQIRGQLEKICTAEGIGAEPGGLKALARAADGSMRDALSLLDQGVAFGGGKIETGPVEAMLGTIDRGHVLRLLEALSAGDGDALLSEVEALDERAPDYSAALDELLAALQRIAVLQLVQRRIDDDDLAALQPLAQRISPEDVQLYYQIALLGRRDLPIARDARMAFEMTLLRMLAFRPAEAGAVPSSPAGGGKSADSVRVSSTAARAAEPAPSARAGEDIKAASPNRMAQSRITSRESASASSGAPATGNDKDRDWTALVQALDLRGPVRQLADSCDLVSDAGGTWQLILAGDKEHLNTQQIRSRLETALKEQFGKDLRLSVVVGTPPRPTPAAIRRSNETERMREARETIENDPNVRAMQAAFEGTIEPDSIRPAK